ncbi:MAG TPA: hypothetical protein VK927_06300 [Adhaeribacter sp.]|nr:hypothetical protein [Adhaeribacter sp.]
MKKSYFAYLACGVIMSGALIAGNPKRSSVETRSTQILDLQTTTSPSETIDHPTTGSKNSDNTSETNNGQIKSKATGRSN